MSARVRREELVFGALLLVAAVHFADLHVDPDAVTPATALERVVAGEAIFPFQYRVVVPALDHGLWRALGAVGLEVELLDVAAAVEALLLVLLVLAFRRLLALFLDNPAAVRLAALALFVPLWTVYLGRDGDTYWHASDVAAVLVFALALVALAEDRVGRFWAVFVLGTFNRETTIFLVPMLLLSHAPHRSRGWMAGHAAGLLLAWAAVKGALVLAYHEPAMPLLPPVGGPEGGATVGRLFAWTPWVNLRRLALEPTHALELLSLFGYALVPVWAFRRHIPDAWTRRLLWVTVPFAASMFFVGVVLEFRIWGELVPVYWLAAVLLAAAALHLSVKPPPVARLPSRP